MAVTKSKTVYSEGTAPLMVSRICHITTLCSKDGIQPGVFQIPYPYWHQLGLPKSTSEDQIVKQSLYQLDLLLKQQTSPNDTAAIIIEPVLGEGGYFPAPAAYLQGLRNICDKNNILLIVDEIQCGFGRTGKNFYIENSGVKPDIMTVAKVSKPPKYTDLCC